MNKQANLPSLWSGKVSLFFEGLCQCLINVLIFLSIKSLLRIESNLRLDLTVGFTGPLKAPFFI